MPLLPLLRVQQTHKERERERGNVDLLSRPFGSPLFCKRSTLKLKECAWKLRWKRAERRRRRRRRWDGNQAVDAIFQLSIHLPSSFPFLSVLPSHTFLFLFLFLLQIHSRGLKELYNYVSSLCPESTDLFCHTLWRKCNCCWDYVQFQHFSPNGGHILSLVSWMTG